MAITLYIVIARWKDTGSNTYTPTDRHCERCEHACACGKLPILASAGQAEVGVAKLREFRGTEVPSMGPGAEPRLDSGGEAAKPFINK